MKTNKEQQTKETKSLKEVVYDNRGKIVAIGGAVIVTTIGFITYKRHKGIVNVLEKTVKQLEKTDAGCTLGIMVSDELWNKVETTENIINNSGIIDQAKATITRKKDTLVGKLNCLKNMVQTNDDIKNKILELKGGIENYDKMLDQCEELEYLYKCANVGEKLLDD